MVNARIPPHSQDAEKSVLGALLIDKDVVVEVVEILRPEMFYSEIHGLIFSAMLFLYENRAPIDAVTVADRLKQDKALTRVGGTAYLAELSGSAPTPANAAKYAQIIKEDYIKRQLISVSGELSDLAFDESQSLMSMLDRAEQGVFALSQKNVKKSFIPIKEALADSFDRLDELLQEMQKKEKKNVRKK